MRLESFRGGPRREIERRMGTDPASLPVQGTKCDPQEGQMPSPWPTERSRNVSLWLALGFGVFRGRLGTPSTR